MSLFSRVASRMASLILVRQGTGAAAANEQQVTIVIQVTAW
ncbi:MAG: hypothetical protein VX644_09925 [Planctomycetota bacterium]|nr:hypothetical protein [Planctomycetota bacterium]